MTRAGSVGRPVENREVSEDEDMKEASRAKKEAEKEEAAEEAQEQQCGMCYRYQCSRQRFL
jgi:hypothetical protein